MRANLTMPWCAAALLAMALPLAAREAATPDAGWILSKLAQPAPTRTQFVEMRGSALLKTPMRISGEYRRPDADTLVREVRAPYAETTTIRGGDVTLERGRSTRTFKLDRAPQLAGLQQGLGALMRGDRTALERDFSLGVTGTRENWRMVMTPRDSGLAREVRDITLYGRGSELRCTETRMARGNDIQRTLMASAAAAAPQAATAAALAQLCQTP